jgi:hypothetical protein
MRRTFENDWVDFDPTNNLLPNTEHITIAVGRDFGDISPLRGIILGGGGTEPEVAVTVTPLDEEELPTLRKEDLKAAEAVKAAPVLPRNPLKKPPSYRPSRPKKTDAACCHHRRRTGRFDGGRANYRGRRPVNVDIFDAMPSVGRKFLMAGKGGMNITHSEAAAGFRRPLWRAAPDHCAAPRCFGSAALARMDR